MTQPSNFYYRGLLPRRLLEGVQPKAPREVELFVGGMFALAIGVWAMGMAALIYADGLGESRVLASWEGILIVFAALTVASTGILRILFQRKDEGDINKY